MREEGGRRGKGEGREGRVSGGVRDGRDGSNHSKKNNEQEFAKGGTLELWLGAEPNKNWGIENSPANSK